MFCGSLQLYEKSETFLWGKGKGCDFLKERCIDRRKVNSFFEEEMMEPNDIQNIKNTENLNSISYKTNLLSNKTNISILTDPNDLENMKIDHSIDYNVLYDTRFKSEFCLSHEEEECSITHVFRAVCGLTRYPSNIPAGYQYFNDPRIGGLTDFGDYCPYPVEWFDSTDMKPVGSCRNGIQLRAELGEKICEKCRCFKSSLVSENIFDKEDKNKIKKLKNLNNKRAACYETKCRLDRNKIFLIIVVEENEIKCPRKGGVLTIEGYKGIIECPKADDVCFGNLDPSIDYSVTSAYGILSELSEKLLNLVYDFIFTFFNNLY